MYTKIAFYLSLATIFAFSGCSSKQDQLASQDIGAGAQSCMQEGVKAPKWTCVSEIDGFYSSVGISQKSQAGIAHMRRVALANGRSELAQQINTLVKDKISVYSATAGEGSSQSVDAATESITKQVAKVDMVDSKAIDMWSAPSGTLYMLVVVPKDATNKQITSNLKSSYKNQEALWQEFKSKNALDELEKEFK